MGAKITLPAPSYPGDALTTAQVAGIQAAPTAITGANPAASMADAGGGGGPLEENTYTTGSIAAGGSEDVQLVAVTKALLMAVSVKRTAGASVSVQAKLYDGDPSSGGSDLGTVIGVGGSVSPVDPQYGPQNVADVYTVPRQIHGTAYLRVVNGSGSDPVTVEIKTVHWKA